MDKLKEKTMKIHCRLAGALVVLICLGFALSGCGTAYSAARDERTIGSVVDDKKIEAKIKCELVRDDMIVLIYNRGGIRHKPGRRQRLLGRPLNVWHGAFATVDSGHL